MRPLVKNTPTEKRVLFEHIVKPYMTSLSKYCQSLGNSKWDGEDLMQETLVKAYKSWTEKPSSLSKAYLFRIASNTWIDQYRKAKIQEELKEDFSSFKQEEENPSEAIYQLMGRIIKEFTSKQRVTLLLIDGFGYSAKEAAELMNESVGSLKASLHRARKKAQDLQWEEMDEDVHEEKVIPYVTAIRTGDADKLVRFYQKESQQATMSLTGKTADRNMLHSLEGVVGIGSLYLVATVRLSNGHLMFIPFYQDEIYTLFLQKKRFNNIEAISA